MAHSLCFYEQSLIHTKANVRTNDDELYSTRFHVHIPSHSFHIATKQQLLEFYSEGLMRHLMSSLKGS